jgi:transcriptional regulator with XRE-family HTH domain
MYMKKRITNPLEKHRRNRGKTQAEVAGFLGITQSQYSRLENAECSPEPYLAKLAEFFNCEEDELYSGNILVELENDFLNDGFKQVGGTYHEKKPDHIYLIIKGWFPNHVAQEAIDYLTEHMEAEGRKGQSTQQPET